VRLLPLLPPPLSRPHSSKEGLCSPRADGCDVVLGSTPLFLVPSSISLLFPAPPYTLFPPAADVSPFTLPEASPAPLFLQNPPLTFFTVGIVNFNRKGDWIICDRVTPVFSVQRFFSLFFQFCAPPPHPPANILSLNLQSLTSFFLCSPLINQDPILPQIPHSPPSGCRTGEGPCDLSPPPFRTHRSSTLLR